MTKDKTEYKIDGTEVLRIAKAVAQRYAARCWWADKDDMTSEASEAILRAQRTFDPQVGVPFDGYAAKAAALRIADWLWKNSSPLSGGTHDPRKHVAGVHSNQLAADRVTPGEETRVGAHHDTAEITDDATGDQLDAMNWRLQVRSRIRALAARTRDGETAVEVMIRERTSGEVIRETGKDVYGAVHLVRRKARNDRELYDLWAAGCGG